MVVSKVRSNASSFIHCQCVVVRGWSRSLSSVPSCCGKGVWRCGTNGAKHVLPILKVCRRAPSLILWQVVNHFPHSQKRLTRDRTQQMAGLPLWHWGHAECTHLRLVKRSTFRFILVWFHFQLSIATVHLLHPALSTSCVFAFNCSKQVSCFPFHFSLPLVVLINKLMWASLFTCHVFDRHYIGII